MILVEIGDCFDVIFFVEVMWLCRLFWHRFLLWLGYSVYIGTLCGGSCCRNKLQRTNLWFCGRLSNEDDDLLFKFLLIRQPCYFNTSASHLPLFVDVSGCYANTWRGSWLLDCVAWAPFRFGLSFFGLYFPNWVLGWDCF